MGIHIQFCAYFASQTGFDTGLNKVYENLNCYYADAAHQLLVGAPNDNCLICYIVVEFKCYSAGAAAIGQLLNYINEHYVEPAVNDSKG
jgi:hypothetical protein